MRGRGLDWLLLIVTSLAAWQFVHWIVGEFALASPLTTFMTLWLLFGDAEFWEAATATGIAFFLAVLFAGFVGLGIGLWLGIHRLSGEVGEPIVVTMYSLPKITLYPVFLLAFGLTLEAKVLFGALHGVIPIALFTIGAVRNIPLVLIKSARAMSLSHGAAIRTIFVPAAFPEIFTGIRIGFSLTLLGVLISDLFASRVGLGAMILDSMEVQDLNRLLAVALFLVIFAVVANVILLSIDRRLHQGLSLEFGR